MQRTIWHYLDGGGYLKMSCPSKCDICPIRFICYTTNLSDKVIIIDNRTLFNDLGKLWDEDWSEFPI